MLFDLSLLFIPLLSFASGFFLFLNSSSGASKVPIKVHSFIQTVKNNSESLDTSCRLKSRHFFLSSFPCRRESSLDPRFRGGDDLTREFGLTNVAEPPRE